jgi:hypothetical protein
VEYFFIQCLVVASGSEVCEENREPMLALVIYVMEEDMFINLKKKKKKQSFTPSVVYGYLI